VVNRRRTPTITGEATLTSPWFSNRWTLHHHDHVLAEVKRIARTYVSVVDMGEHGRLTLEPSGRGMVHALDQDDKEIGRITRQSWLGRRWELDGMGFTYELISDPRPRRWHLAVANAPVTYLAGSMFSYNHVRVHSPMTVPVPAVLLAWHVIARPWEAANEPRHLVPASVGVPRQVT
jgi:hypothetical protein